MELQRRTAVYTGSVQGVGFRFTACRLAGGYDLAGYVRNRPDGAVEVVVEGSPAEIDAFLEDLARQMAGYVRAVRLTPGAYEGKFGGFDVRY